MKTARLLLAVAAILCASGSLLVAQVSVTGGWEASIQAPRGTLEYRMYLNQEGPRVTGYFQSEYGEMPLKGTINNDAITLTWEMPDAGKPIAVTMKGTVKGDAITGEATLGKVGTGTFNAQRMPN